MNIVILNWRLPWDRRAGGAERVTIRHAQAWIAAGHRVWWISGSSRGFWVERKTWKNIVCIGCGPSSLFFLFAWVYRAIWVRVPIDCIVDQVHGFPAWSVLFAPATAKVVLLHELATEIWDRMYAFPIAIIGRYIESTVFPSLYAGEQFWVDSPSVARDLIRIGIPEKNVAVIPCAIDVPNLPRRPKKQLKFTCIVVSRLVPMKGVEYAIDVFARVHAKHPDTQLWVVGDGDPAYVQQLSSRCIDLGVAKHVRFFGRVGERKKYALLSASHLLLHTSYKEGFGLTVLEAESMGVPCAVFDVRGLCDLVVDQENGIKVPFGDTVALAKKVIRLKSDEKTYTTLSKRAYRHSKTFNWDQLTSESTALLTAVVNERKTYA